MPSIYQRALGSDFKKLHPKIQERFGFDSEDGIASIGAGVMDEIWRGRFYTVPFLYVGTWRRIMFPEHGRNIPFTIENYAYRDSFGRETVSWVRTFEGRRRRRFDAYMIYSESRGRIVDYLGSHQHLAVDLDVSVDARGACASDRAHSDSTKGELDFRSRCSSRGSPQSVSGMTTNKRSFASRLRSRTRRGVVCLAITDHLTLHFKWSLRMGIGRTSNRCAKSVENSRS